MLKSFIRASIYKKFGLFFSPPFLPLSSEDDEKKKDPVFDIDLGAFELVDSGVTAEALLSHEEPVIYHKDMPVHR